MIPKTFLTAAAAVLLSSSLASAQDAPLLRNDGPLFSWMFTNDVIGDGGDRWRTGAYSLSALKPLSDGAVGELRIRGEVVSGAEIDLAEGDEIDRRMAGILGVGLFRSDRLGAFDYRLGAEVISLGPSNGVVDVQAFIHEQMGIAPPSDYAKDTQIGNRILFGANGEIGRDYALADNVSLRPWVGAAIGTESVIRTGADFVWGHAAGAYGVREEVTGWRKPVNDLGNANTGMSLLAGLDVAHVSSSELLGEDMIEPVRVRARLGGITDFRGGQIFYGATWMSEEFKAQSEPQVVGAISFGIRF